MQILVCNGVAVVFFFADKGYVITLQKHNGNGRIKPGNVVADKKKTSVLWDMLTTDDLNSYMYYSQKEGGSFHKDSIEKNDFECGWVYPSLQRTRRKCILQCE